MAEPFVSGSFKRPAAIVLDMDGLLIDSERLARDIFIEACNEFGYQPDLEVYRQVVGSTHGATQVILREGYGAAVRIDGKVVTAGADPRRTGAAGALTGTKK